jgi:superfamily II DNA or RNA helicase
MNGRAQRVEADLTGESLLGRLRRDDIEAVTSKSAFHKGERYWREGRVAALAVENGGTLIKARVRGSGPKPYTQTIELADDGPHLQISGLCSCPVGFDCKHVAAALFAALARGSGGANRTGWLPQLPLPRPPQPPQAPVRELLAPDISAWIDDLARLGQTEDYPPAIRQRLLYLIDLGQRAIGAPYLVVRPTSLKLLKDDTFSDQTSAFDLQSKWQRNGPKFLRPSDLDILGRLRSMSYAVAVHPGVALVGEDGAATLEAMIGTGRARWRSPAGPPVTLGPPRAARLAWRLTDDGSYLPNFELENGGAARVVRLTPPWYVEMETATVGPLETGFAPHVAGSILSAPPIPARQTALVRAAIERRLPGLPIDPPQSGPVERITGPPVPGLRLMKVDLQPRHYYGFGGGRLSTPEQLLFARPFYRYGGVDIKATDPQSRPTFARGDTLVEIERDRNAERRARSRLAELGFVGLYAQRPYDLSEEHRSDVVPAHGDETHWYKVLFHDVPALREAGWVVEIEPDFPIRLVETDGDVLAELREGSGIDWFELALGVRIDGERLDLVPAILAALTRPDFKKIHADAADGATDGQTFYLPLSDGRVLAMPAERLRPILAAIRELFEGGDIGPDAQRLGFSPRDVGGVAEFEAATAAAGMLWQGGEQLRQLGRLLRDTGTIPRCELPTSFTATLRPYQARGVDWLQFLRSAGLGGILADDMGLGKTVQALGYLAIEKASGRMDRPALIVCPTSVVANWRREAQRFAPDLKVLTLHGLDRKSRFADIAAHDLVLTTYPLLARDHAVLTAQGWHALVLDEAQTIKNPNAATTKLVGEIEARHRLCLTGTPLENNLGELWSLFTFLSPGFLGDRTYFNRHWRAPIEKRGNGERRRKLARRVRPFMLRRTKSEVAADLPPKTEIVEPVEMEQPQRDLYESIRLTMHAKVRAAIAAKGLARSRIDVLDALLKLRQVCCDPRLLKLKVAATAKARSAKLDRLLEMLPELIEEGRRVLLFSQFTSMLALIEKELDAAAIRYVLLTGDTRDRETPIRQFQDGTVPLFLISLRAGGLGLNLTAADTVIHYDPWWNPAVEDQATDRAHRLGQDKPVFVHKLVMLASIEEKMEALKARKRALAAGLFDPEAGTALDLTEADVEDLFAPL